MNHQIDSQDIFNESAVGPESIPEEFLEESLFGIAQSWWIDADNIDVSQRVLAVIGTESATELWTGHGSTPMPAEFAPFLEENFTDIPSLTTDQEQRLAHAVANGESWGQLVFVNSNRRLADTAIKKYSNRGIDADTLMAEAMVALSKATEKFDPLRGFRFSTYASFWIRRSLSRFVESHQSQFNDRNAPTYVASLGEVTASDFSRRAAEMEIPFIDLKRHKSEEDALKAVTPEFAWKHHVLPIRKVGNRLWVAMRNASDVSAIDDVRMASKCLVQPMMTNAAELEEAILKAYGTLDSPPPADSPNGVTLPAPELSDDISRVLRETLLEMRRVREELTSLRREIAELRQERTGTVPRPSITRLFPFAPPESASHRNR